MIIFMVIVTIVTKQTRERSASYEVVQPMNDHGAMCVVDPSTDTVFHVVDYDNGRLRQQLERFTTGDSVRLTLDRVSGRGTVWEATWQ